MSNRELPTKTKSLGIVRGFEVFNSTRSVPLYLASDARRRLHWGCHPINDGEARPSTPSRGRTGRIGASSRLEFVPIVCDPDVAGRINRHVGYHLDASALKNVVKVTGLKSPFDIVIDSQNRVWVANSSSDTVVRFPANDPTKVESFRAGIGVRALALDSKENVWVASNMDLRTPQPKLPEGISIMEQFKLITDHMFKYIEGPPARITGAVNMIRPDGTQPAPDGFTGPGESIPWGINVDGNDDVWVGNMWGRSAALLAGDNTAGHPRGTKAGDVIHIFQSGTIQMVTDVSIDPAGNVWVANNWNSLQ